MQDFKFVTYGEAMELLKAICRGMHGPDIEFSGFSLMPSHVIFEKLVGFKPHELLFMKTSAAIDRRAGGGESLKLRVQDPPIDGSIFYANCEKERHVSVKQAFYGVDVFNCVIVEVDVKNFSVGVGNRRWMMNMHMVIAQPSPKPRALTTVRHLVPQQPANALHDSVVRRRFNSLSWFKNISVNEAKEVCAENQMLAFPLFRAGCQDSWGKSFYCLPGCFGEQVVMIFSL